MSYQEVPTLEINMIQPICSATKKSIKVYLCPYLKPAIISLSKTKRMCDVLIIATEQYLSQTSENCLVKISMKYFQEAKINYD